jgi:phosphinothricin acetyltransferase
VRETTITFDVAPLTPDERRPWLLSPSEDGPRRLLVARGSASGDECPILGFATSSAYRTKAAYFTSVETSTYLASGSGRRTATLLHKALFAALATQDPHRAHAGIALPNEASLRRHERLGFLRVGISAEAGRKFGRHHDVAWHEKRLS